MHLRLELWGKNCSKGNIKHKKQKLQCPDALNVVDTNYHPWLTGGGCEGGVVGEKYGL